MKEQHEFCDELLVDLRRISNELFAYNPGVSSKKVPLVNICQSIATLMYSLAKLRLDIIGGYKNGVR